MKEIFLAQDYELARLKSASAEANEMIQQARGRAAAIVAEAQGKAAVLNAQRHAYAASPNLTHARLYFDLLDRVLPGLRKYINLSDAPGTELDFWLSDGTRIQGSSPLGTPLD